MKQKLLRNLFLLCALIVGSSAWAEKLTVDFESTTDTYSDWTFTNITTQQTNSGVAAHGGSYFGTTGGKTSGSLVTKSKISAPESITFYISKTSSNTTASSWLVKVSSDGTEWTKVGDAQSASSGITKGTWTEVTRNLSDYSDVYVGIFYDGTTAERAIDDVTLVYTSGGDIPAISISTESVNATADETEGTITVTYNNITTVVADIVWYSDETATVETSEPEWISAEISQSNNVDYLIDANTGAERKAYMKVYALDDEGNDVYSKLITITQAKYVVPDVQVDPAVAGVGAFVKVTNTDDITAGNYLIVYEGDNSHDAVAFNGGLEKLDAENNGIKIVIVDNKIPSTAATVAATFTLQLSGSLKSASGLYIGRSANSNGLESNENEALANTFTIEDGSAVITAACGRTLRYNYAKGQLRFRYYKDGQQDVQLYKYDDTVPAFDAVAVTSAGYATFVSDVDLDYSAVEGLKAYKATVNGTSIAFEAVTTVPAGEGVLLKADEGTYTVPAAAAAVKWAAEDNAFVRGTGEAVASENGDGVYNYILNVVNNVPGFYKAAGNTVAKNRAYLQSTLSAARIGISLEGETTGISITPALSESEEVVYDLQGRRVAQPQKGMYIVNGKKVVVK